MMTPADIIGQCNESYTGDDLIEALAIHGYSIQSRDAPNLRIEALRAASTITAGCFADGTDQFFLHGQKATANEWTLHYAEQFAAWLETGER